MRVESFTSTNGLTRYILVDSSGVPVDVVLRFLRFKDNCGRARNTLRAYCFHLKSILNTWNSLECLFRRSAWTNWRGLFDGFKTITGRRKLCLSLRRQFPHAPPKQLMSTCQRYMRSMITYPATKNIDCGCQINSHAQ